MSFNKRVDKNQKEVVSALRNEGMTVGHTHAVGQGFPDIVVSATGLTLVGKFSKSQVKKILSAVEGVRVIDGVNIIFEIKDENQPPSKRKLTPDEVAFHETWQGPLFIVNNAKEAIAIFEEEKE